MLYKTLREIKSHKYLCQNKIIIITEHVFCARIYYQKDCSLFHPIVPSLLLKSFKGCCLEEDTRMQPGLQTLLVIISESSDHVDVI